MKIKSFSHVGITVKNFEKAVRWYSEVFGFTLISEMDFSAVRVEELKKIYNLPKGISLKLGFLRAPKGGVVEIFEFSAMQKMTHTWNMSGATHFALDVNNIKKWHKHLQERGDVQILCPPQDTHGNEWFFFRDPDGNLVELIDVKLNYLAIHYLGCLLPTVMRKFVFKKYYQK